MRNLIFILCLFPVAVMAQSVVSTGNDVIYIGDSVAFSSVGGFKMKGDTTGFFTIPRTNFPYNVLPASKRVVMDNPKARFEIRGVEPADSANFFFDVLANSNRVQADVSIRTPNSKADYQAGLEYNEHPEFRDIPVIWTLNRDGALPADTHQLVFIWGDTIEKIKIPGKRLFVQDYISQEWLELQFENMTIDETNNVLVYNGFEGQILESRFRIAQPIPVNGDLYVVDSGGDVENSTWIYENGILSTLKSPAYVNASDVLAKLALGDLVIQAKNITVDSAATVAKTAGGDASLTLKASDRIMHYGTISSTSGSLDVVLWVESDGGTSYGAHCADVTTNGGHFWIGGGADTAIWNGLLVGSAVSEADSTVNVNGVDLAGDISTDGGDILIAADDGHLKDNSHSSIAAFAANRILDAGTGHITLLVRDPSTFSFNNNTITLKTTGTLTIAPPSSENWLTEFNWTGLATSQFTGSGHLTGLVIDNYSTLGGLAIGTYEGTGVSGDSSFVASNSRTITFDSAAVANGQILVYTDTIHLKNNLTSTGSGTPVVLKALKDIYLTNGADVTTSGGDIVLWSNRNNETAGTSGHRIALENGTNLLSNGGDIVFGGGADANMDGQPDGYAYMGGADSAWSAVTYIDTVAINSANGDIIIRGASSAAADRPGIDFRGVVTIQSGSGTIAIDGKTSVTQNALAGDHELSGIFVSGNLKVTSASDSAGAIVLNGDATGSSANTGSGTNRIHGIKFGTTGRTEITATASGGGVLLNALGAHPDYAPVNIGHRVYVLATDGPIDIQSTGGNEELYIPASGRLVLGSANADSTMFDVSASTSAIALFSNLYNLNATDQIAVNTADSLSILPVDDADDFFTDTLDVGNKWAIANSVTALVIGGADNTEDVRITDTINISGWIEIYAGNIDINDDLITTSGAADGDVLLKASANITVAPDQSVSTSGGDVIFWANTDGEDTNGGVFFDGGSTVTTSGGHIWVGGSASNGSSTTWNGLTVGDGPAVSGRDLSTYRIVSGGSPATIGHEAGVLLNEATIQSSGGHIYMSGKRHETVMDKPGAGVINYSGNSGTLVDAGTGTIYIQGESAQVFTGNNPANADLADYGVLTAVNADDYSGIFTLKTSNITDSLALTLVGNTASQEEGIRVHRHLRLLSTGASGGMLLSGSSSIGSAVSLGTGSGMDTLDLFSTSGPVTLDVGTDSIAVGSMGHLRLGSASGDTDVASSSANVYLISDDFIWNQGSVPAVSSGVLTIKPSPGQSFTTVLNTVPLTYTSLGGLVLGHDQNTAGDVTIGSVTTLPGNITVYARDINVDSSMTATSKDISLTATGRVSQLSPLTANGLALNGTGRFILNDTTNNIVTLAGGDSMVKLDTLVFTDATGGLTIGSVNPEGLTASGPILVETLEGDIVVEKTITSDNTSDQAIVINAGVRSEIGDLTGGSIRIKGYPKVTPGSGGIARMYSSSINQSSGLNYLVGLENVREGVDETTTVYDPVLSVDNTYALYRYMTPVEYQDDSTLINGNKIGMRKWFSVEDPGADDAESYVFDFLVPTTVDTMDFFIYGGGGGGAGATFGNWTIRGGGGGGGGAEVRRLDGQVLTPEEIITIQVGKNGLGGSGDQNGTDGAMSYVIRAMDTIVIAKGGLQGLRGREGSLGGNAPDSGKGGRVVNAGQVGITGSKTTTAPDNQVSVDNSSDSWIFRGMRVAAGASGGAGRDCSLGSGTDFSAGGSFSDAAGVMTTSPGNRAGGNGDGGDNSFINSDNGTINAVPASGSGGGGGGFTASSNGKGGGNGGAGSVLLYYEPADRAGSTIDADRDSILVKGDSTLVTLQLRDENGTAANVSVGTVKFHAEGPPVIFTDVVDNLDGTYTAMMYSIWESGDVIVSASIQDSAFFDTDTVTIYATPDNADLAKLDVTLGSIHPDFHPDTLIYTDSIIGPDYVFIIPTAMNKDAKVEVNGVVVAYKDSTEVILLTPGDTVFTIVVTSQDMTKTKTYQLTLTKFDLSTFGGITIVSSGADAQGTTWNYAGGVLTPTSASPANVHADSVVAKMALGDLYIAGSKITIDASFESTDNSQLTLKSTSDILHNDAKNITMNGGNLIYWADSDSTDGGSIQMLGSTDLSSWAADIQIKTKGGDIFMGGNFDSNYDGRPDGFARSSTTYRQGIFTRQVLLDASVSGTAADSVSGDVTLNGWSSNTNNSSTDAAIGLWTRNTRIYANEVTLKGEHTATGSVGQGFDFNNYSNIYAYGDVTMTGTNASSANALRFGANPALSSTAGNMTFIVQGKLDYLSSAGLSISSGNDITFDVSTDASVNTPISGGGGLVKKGSGTLTLQNTLTYTDSTKVLVGILKASSGSDSSSLHIANGATYDLQANVSSGGLSGSGTLLLNSYTFTTGTQSQTDTFSGTVSGSGALVKAGTDTLTLNGTISYSGATTLNGGTLRVEQDDPSLSTSGFSGTGALAVVPKSTSFSSAFTWTQSLGSTLTGLTIGKSGNSVDITITPAITLLGPATIFGKDITLTGGLVATNDTIRLHATGAVSQGGGIKANALALFGAADFNLTNVSNNIGTIAGGDSTTMLGSLAFVDSIGGLTIGSVNPTGINATGPVRIETLEGDLRLNANLLTTNGTDSAIVLNAGKARVIGEAFGGTLLVADSLVVSMGTGGIAKFFSSADPLSTGLRKLIGGDTVNIRKEVDETTAVFDPVLEADSMYALYRTGDCVPPVDGGEIAGMQTICKNEVPVPLTTVALPLGSVGTLAYKWQESTTDSTSGFADVSGDTNEETFPPGQLSQTTWFRRIGRVTCLDDGWDSSDTSNAVAIMVSDTFLAGAILSTGEVICPGGTPSTIGSSTLPTGGDGTYSYSWRSSADMFMSAISGADSATFTPPAGLLNTTTYRRYATDDACQPSFVQSSGEWTVTVRAAVSAGAIDTVGESICSGGTPSQISSLTAASGGDSTITYSWRSSADNFATDISGATSATYTPPSGLTTTTAYRRYATDGTCAVAASQSSGEWVVSVPAGLAFTQPDGSPFSPYQLQNTPFDVRVTLVDANGDLVPSPTSATVTLTASGGTGVGNTLSFADGSTPVSQTIAEDSAAVNFSNEITDNRIKFSGLSDSLTNDPDIMLTASVNVCGGFSQTDSITSRDKFFDVISAEAFLIANGADSSQITVTLREASDSSVISGDSLWVQTSAGRFDFLNSTIVSDTGFTDGNGQFLVKLYADTLFDTARVAANMVGADPRFVDVPFVGETPFADSCTVDVTTPHRADSIDASTVTITLKDNYGNPVPYKVESDFTIQVTGITGSSIGDLTEVGNGVYTFEIVSVEGGTLNITPEVSGVTLATKSIVFECEQPASAGQISMNQDICSGSAPLPLTSTAPASGFKGVLQYQWQDSTDAGMWADVVGAVDSTYQPPILSQHTWYRRLASVKCASGSGVASNAIQITVEESPVSGSVTKYPTVDILCAADSISADFTPGSGGNGRDTAQYRFYGQAGWTVWAPYESGQDIARTNQDTLQIRTVRLGGVCDDATPVVVSWSFEQVAKPAELMKSPNLSKACLTDSVSATYTSGKGGNGIDSVDFRVHDGSSWSNWSAYPSDSLIAAAGLDSIEIRSIRFGTYCSNSAFNVVKWATEEVAVVGTLSKTPDVSGVCIGSTVSANYTAGSGGNGIDSLEYRLFSGTTWSSWTVYPSDSQLISSSLDTVQVKARRMAVACPVDSSVATWIIEDTAFTATLVKVPDATLVCEEDSVSATVTGGIGGNGVDTMDYRRHNGSNWSSWTLYTAGDKIANQGFDTIEVRTRRNTTYCDLPDYSTVQWVVNQYPVAGTFQKTPNTGRVCEGTPVAAELTAGMNGNGVDSLHYRTHDGSVWGNWIVYTSKDTISTFGKDSVEIRTRRMDDLCEPSDFTTVSWSVEPTPVAGMLTKTAGFGTVCNGEDVSASFTAGTGGNGKDTVEVRTHDGTSWSSWAPYTASNLISTTGKDTVEVRTRRLADVCNASDNFVLRWEISRSPVTTIALQGSPCFGDTITLTENGGSATSWQWSGPNNYSNTSQSIVLAGAPVGAYIVVTTDGVGCTGTDTLVVNSLPSVIASNDGPRCSKEEILRLYEMGGAAVSWKWTTPSGFISTVQNPALSPSVSGDYIVEVTSEFGCINRDTTIVCVDKPTANCVDEITIYLDEFGQATLSPADVNNGSLSGSCLGISQLSLNKSTFSCSDLGTRIVQLTVRDSAGCSDKCTAEVMVRDSTMPVVSCEALNELILVWSGTVVSPSSMIGEIDDNCPGQNFQFSFTEDFSTPAMRFNCREILQGPMDLEVYIKDAWGNVSSCQLTQVFPPHPISEDCECDGDDLMVDGVIGSDDYKASKVLIGMGTVMAGDTVLFKAQDSILLKPGFAALPGSRFSARIDSCGSLNSYFDDGVTSPRDEGETSTGQSIAAVMTSKITPNPFSGQFTLQVVLSENAALSVILHPVHGGEGQVIMEGSLHQKGMHTMTIDASRIPAGVYILTVSSGDYRMTHRVVRIR